MVGGLVGVLLFSLISARREVHRLKDQVVQHWTAWSVVITEKRGILAVGLAHDQMGPIPEGALVIKTRAGRLYAVHPDGKVSVHRAVDYRRLRWAEKEL